MLRTLGAGLVGMSTVYETHCREADVEVLGISLVTNLAAGITGEPLNHTEVLEAGRAAAQDMGELLAELVGSCNDFSRSGYAKFCNSSHQPAVAVRHRGATHQLAGEMNVTTATRATAGVAQWLKLNRTPLRRDGRYAVAVGYDARYGSQAMARATAEAFAGAGFEVTLIAEPAPTPVLAWLVRDRGLDAGVQITASHNPASDNGYKLYLQGGSQLISPADREIEAVIAEQPATAGEIPVPKPRTWISRLSVATSPISADWLPLVNNQFSTHAGNCASCTHHCMG